MNDDAFNARPSDNFYVRLLLYYVISHGEFFFFIFRYFRCIVLGRCKIDSKEKLKVMQLHN